MELENGISAKTGAETHGTKPRARAGLRSRMSSRQKASAEVENAVDAEPSSMRSRTGSTEEGANSASKDLSPSNNGQIRSETEAAMETEQEISGKAGATAAENKPRI